MEFKDYYKTLAIERNATQEEIKRSYRKLARKYHPDVNKDPAAEARFKEIGEAYGVLKDPEKRAAYDNLGSEWKEGQDFRPPPNWGDGFGFSGDTAFTGGQTDFSDFFEELFGGKGRRPASTSYRSSFSARGEDHYAKIAIDLEDSFYGMTRTISLKTTEIDGQTGHLVIRPHTLNVTIPKGVREGQRIRLPGQGGIGMGDGGRGDLYIEIVFNQHPLFWVDKRDILLDLPITPWEAALGATITAPVLGGSVELKIPSNSQAGQKMRLKGKGIPGNPTGDQYVILKIVTPKADSDKAKEFYKRMAKELPMNPRVSLGKR
jgi:curved DNA-binding protein